jgi:predicted transcriptional regulator
MKKRYGQVTDEGKLLIELPISRRDMAEMIGVRSESLSRTIRQMTDEGILTFSGRRVWIDTADLLINELEPWLDLRAGTGCGSFQEIGQK